MENQDMNISIDKSLVIGQGIAYLLFKSDNISPVLIVSV